MNIKNNKDIKVIKKKSLSKDYVFVKDEKTDKQWIMKLSDLKAENII